MPNKILIADDDKEMVNALLEVLKELPEDLDVQLMTVNNASEVLPAIEANPDLKFIYLDILFKGEDETGLDVLKKINKKYPDLKVVILTASSTPDRMFTAMRDLDAYEYLEKPASIKVLLYMTEMILRGQYQPLKLK